MSHQSPEVRSWSDLTQSDKFKCKSCGDECCVIEETFDYAGSHCTHGASGTHRTGIYVSDCCLSDYDEAQAVDMTFGEGE